MKRDAYADMLERPAVEPAAASTPVNVKDLQDS
jgi:hypothetical protein